MKKSFTLIELLIAIAIIGILTAIITFSLANVRAKARDTRRLADLDQIALNLELYYNYSQHYPLWEGGGFFISGNPLTMDTTSSPAFFTEQFMKIIPKDPLPNKYACYYQSDAIGANFKLVTYLEEDTDSSKNDGGTADKYYEVFTGSTGSESVIQLSDATLDSVMAGYVSSQAAFNFALSVSPSSGSVTQGTSGTTTLTATLIGGTTQSVGSFSCSGLPSGASCSFTPTFCNLTCSTTVTISTSPTTPAGTYSVFLSAINGGLTRQTTYSLTVLRVAPSLFCSVKSSCSLGEKLIFKMFSLTNGHAELWDQTRFSYYVCCSSNDETFSNTCENNFVDIALRLFYETNSHVAQKNYESYTNRVCLSSANNNVECMYADNSCPSGYTCLASMFAERDAHVGDCNSAFTRKVCCRLY